MLIVDLSKLIIYGYQDFDYGMLYAIWQKQFKNLGFKYNVNKSSLIHSMKGFPPNIQIRILPDVFVMLPVLFALGSAVIFSIDDIRV